MAKAYDLKAGQTITATAIEGRIHVYNERLSEGRFTRGSVSFGPYMIDTYWLVDGEATVTLADHLTAVNALVYANAGAPDDAAQATVTINPTGDDNSLTYTAKVYGAEGNGITVAYVDPGANDAELSVSVFRQAITVSLATNGSGTITSTAADVLAAINASEAGNLVSVAIDAADTGDDDDGSGVVTAMAADALEGGGGTAIGIVVPGGLLIDTANGDVYRNSGTQAVPAWTQLADVA